MPICETPEQTILSGVFVKIRSITVDDLSVILVYSVIKSNFVEKNGLLLYKNFL